MNRPEYRGKTKYLSPTIKVRSYFLETAIGDWDLTGFLLLGQEKEAFQSGLKKLSELKSISRDIRAFAKTLVRFYSVEQNVTIAVNSAEELLNRQALKGFEHRIIQNELQDSLKNDLRRKQIGNENASRVDIGPREKHVHIVSTSSLSSTLSPITAADLLSVPDELSDKDLEESSTRIEGLNGSSTTDNQDSENESNLPTDLATVASCTPFASLVTLLYAKHGHIPGHIPGPISFPSNTMKDLYNFAKGAVENWHSSTRIQQKNCLVALSGIINTLEPAMQQYCKVFSDIVDQCHDKELFTVSDKQKQIYSVLKRRLGQGTSKELRALRRFCSRYCDDSEEVYDENGWPQGEEDAIEEQLKIMKITCFLCDEIISMQRVSRTSEHEDVFVWRGLARLLYDHDLVVRVGELGSSATREDRTTIENEFGGTDTNVRGRKIDIMHQLCLQGNSKPIDVIAWEAKSEAVSGEALQIQLRKNIRINASIMNNLSQYMERDFPRPSPMVLDIVGSRALVYTVRKIESGVFGAGAVGEKMIELPTNASEIAEFLDGGSMSALLRIGHHNSQFAHLLKKGYKKTLSEEVMAKMTGKPNVRKEGPPVIFTPKKKQKQKQKQQEEE
ncbi:hypothetical protein FBU30_009249 [Linnemannia zychae]|nr:hypothetical protein FBU30_009249 [Linnemannia zychae]